MFTRTDRYSSTCHSGNDKYENPFGLVLDIIIPWGWPLHRSSIVNRHSTHVTCLILNKGKGADKMTYKNNGYCYCHAASIIFIYKMFNTKRVLLADGHCQ